MKRSLVVTAALVVAVAGCSGSGSTSKNTAGSPPLVIHAVDSGTFQEDFNPYHLENVNFGTSGMIYETLEFFNKLKPGEITPWLALEHKWSDDGKTITFTLRHGVKWTDGQPFTADDVAFSFDLLGKNPQLNRSALEIAGTKALAPDKVQITFKSTSYAKLYNIAGNTPIVPKHMWEKQQDPVTFTNPKPVGTGPYKLSKFSCAALRDGEEPRLLAAGQAEGADGEVPRLHRQRGADGAPAGRARLGGRVRARHRQDLRPGQAGDQQVLLPARGRGHSAAEPRQPDPGQARGPAGHQPGRRPGQDRPGGRARLHQAGAPDRRADAGGDAYLPAEYKDAAFKVDVEKAKELLKGVDPAKLSFTLLVPSPFTDWVNAAQLIREDLAKVGIKVDTRGVAFADWVSKVGKGDYDLSIRATPSGPTPYFQMRSMLYGDLAQPVGKPGTGNYERWKDAETDKLINEYAATEDQAEQQKAVQGLGKIMVEKVPTVPLFYSPAWSQYRTDKYVGWPSARTRTRCPRRTPHLTPPWCCST